MSNPSTRSFEISVELQAPPEDVWRALTEARELERWFPLQARVQPGVGGSVRYSWDGSWEGESRIEIWEPPRHLRLVDARARPYDLEGRPVDTAPLPVAMDFRLEGAAGGTILRLVHSGFGSGRDWDDEYDGVSRGWTFELAGFAHYLARHKGRDRRVSTRRAGTRLSAAESWARLTGAEGFALRLEGERYTLREPEGGEWRGRVLCSLPPWGHSGTLEALDDALLRLAIEHVQGRCSAAIWLATWGVEPGRLAAFDAAARRLLARLFPE